MKIILQLKRLAQEINKKANIQEYKDLCGLAYDLLPWVENIGESFSNGAKVQ